MTGGKWTTKNLNYYYDSFAQDVSRSDMKDAISRAWRVWSDVTPLTFTEVEAKAQAHIIIQFVRGNHGDGEYAAFDGPGDSLLQP